LSTKQKEKITFNNNFFVPKDVINSIKAKQKDNKDISHDENLTLNAVKLRVKFCLSENIHYFVIDSYLYPESAYCHWCGLKVVDYE
jgi:hypothetical protein